MKRPTCGGFKPKKGATDLEAEIIAKSVGYNFNEDPFDAAIVATAVEFETPLITKDVAIIESNLVEIYW